MAYKRIVLATDGSPSAETAEHVAATLTAATKAKLTIVHVAADPSVAGEAVARALRIAEREGIKHEVVISTGDPAEAIIHAAEEADAEIIVTGSKGLFHAEQLIGSVVRKVLTHAPCDVLLTRARDEADRPHGSPPYRRILLATDGSATADRAAHKAYALAGRLEASMTLAFVGHPKTGELVLSDTAATIGESAPVGMLILDGDPAEQIVATADKEGFDLVMVGNKGMSRRPGRPPGLGAARYRRERDVRRPRGPNDRPEPLGDRAGRGRDRRDRRSKGRRLPRRARQGHDAVGQVHPHGLHGEVEPGREDMGLPLSRLALRSDGRRGERPCGTPAATDRPLRPRRHTCQRGFQIISQVMITSAAIPKTALNSAPRARSRSSSSSSLLRGTPDGRSWIASFSCW